MLATVLLTFCLLSAPDDCESVDPHVEKMGIVECMVMGQQIGAAYAEDHPKWAETRRFKGQQCQIGERPRFNRKDRDA